MKEQNNYGVNANKESREREGKNDSKEWKSNCTHVINILRENPSFLIINFFFKYIKTIFPREVIKTLSCQCVHKSICVY